MNVAFFTITSLAERDVLLRRSSLCLSLSLSLSLSFARSLSRTAQSLPPFCGNPRKRITSACDVYIRCRGAAARERNSFTPISIKRPRNRVHKRCASARASARGKPNCYWKTIPWRAFFVSASARNGEPRERPSSEPTTTREKREKKGRERKRKRRREGKKCEGVEWRRTRRRGGREPVGYAGVPPSLGIFNYAKLPRDINNAG